jgi:glycosyltransferase involved in cell wall biosynthesis
MNDSLSTVVIPTWNRWPLVAEAVASVVAQSWRNWELIVVDDGSTDDTLTKLEALSVPNLLVIRSPHIGHLGRLRNLGARLGKGEYVAFLDSDDLWCASKLERQIGALQNSSADWSYTEYALLSEEGERMPLRSGRAPAVSGHITRALLKEETAVCPCTLLVRRSLFEKIGGFREEDCIPYRGDSDLALRLARACEAVAIPETLALVREHPGRMTHDIAAPYEHSAAVYELFLQNESDRELRALARRSWARCLANAGAERMGMGEYNISAKLFRKALTEAGLTGDWLRAAARGTRNRVFRSARVTAPAQRP